MEYYELIKTIEFDIEEESMTKMVRVELLCSNVNADKYRAKLMELTDYNLYPSLINSGPKGEDLRQCHSADRVWRDLPIGSMELYTGFIAASEEAALERAINEMLSAYGRA